MSAPELPPTESAIPAHLQCPRSRQRRIPDDYAPPYPAWVARHPTTVRQVVMAYFGVQYQGDAHAGAARHALERITALLAGTDGAAHRETAHYVDEAGYDTLIAIAYWDDPQRHERWRSAPAWQHWWNDPQRGGDGLGYFAEVLTPTIERYETLFSTPDRLEGIAVLAGQLSAPIQEHAYWGGMRDRIPLSQTDAMAPLDALQLEASPDGASPAAGGRVRVTGQHNLALIRSGQEWTDTTGRERELYLEDMEPVLREGMDYLRDQGKPIGCFSNRYMTVLDDAGQPLQKSFGMSWWRSLAAMERWSESHPTHVAIFGTFMRIVQELNFDLKLRLYHEVSVAAADQQYFEYVNCHPRTGLLNAATQ